MRKSLLVLAPLALMNSGPAHATGGMVCSGAAGMPVRVSLVIGHYFGGSIVGAQLSVNGRVVPATIAQAWLDRSELRLDLVDRNAMRQEAQLRAKRNGRFYDGSLLRDGVRRWIRCRED